MKKAITRVLVDEVMPIKDGEAHYDCNFNPFVEKIKKMNEMGCPITMDDLIEITEDRLSGKRIEPPHESNLRYTYIIDERIE